MQIIISVDSSGDSHHFYLLSYWILAEFQPVVTPHGNSKSSFHFTQHFTNSWTMNVLLKVQKCFVHGFRQDWGYCNCQKSLWIAKKWMSSYVCKGIHNLYTLPCKNLLTVKYHTLTQLDDTMHPPKLSPPFRKLSWFSWFFIQSWIFSHELLACQLTVWVLFGWIAFNLLIQAWGLRFTGHVIIQNNITLIWLKSTW